jgi:hypothetical protein
MNLFPHRVKIENSVNYHEILEKCIHKYGKALLWDDDNADTRAFFVVMIDPIDHELYFCFKTEEDAVMACMLK